MGNAEEATVASIRVRRRRWLSWTAGKAAHIEGRLLVRERDDEGRSLPVPNVLPPGRTRYQNHSAGLPSGVAGFRGLGNDADEPAITVDLAALESEESSVDA
ncbi:MAG: hypothetical protein PVI35_04170 [Acidimicrobiia bacterium]